MGDSAHGLRATLVGSPRLEWLGTTEIEPPTRKGLALVAYLAARGLEASRAELAELLWTGSPSGLANLRWELHQLRQLPGADEWLVIDGAAATVAVNAATDLRELERAVQEGSFQRALELCHDPAATLLAGLEPRGALGYAEWLEAERERLTQLMLKAHRGRLNELERQGDLGEARALATAALSLDPLDEESHRAVMRLALKQNDLPAAAEQFEACRRLLAAELGLEPTPATLELAAAIERAATAPPVSPRAPRRIPPELLRPPLLVGREEEWARLQAAWDRHQLIFVSGQPGVGKSRLVQDFIRAQVGDDVCVLPGFPSDQLVPFSGYARGWRGVYAKKPHLEEELEPWVRAEVSRFLPELAPDLPAFGPPEPGDLRFAGAMRELYRQLLENFGAAMVDDIQYFDPTSWRLGGASLQELYGDPTRRPRLGRMLIVFRTDEMPGAFMAGVAGLVAAGAAVHVELEPLGQDAIHRMLKSLGADPESAGPGAAELERLTGGNPLYMLEVLRKLFESGAWDGGPDLHLEAAEADLLPESVHRSIWKRLERLPDEAQRAAQALAVLQEAATRARLAHLLEVDEARLAELLTELERAQVVDDLAFSHDLLQESVLRRLPQPVARLLHDRAARLLEAEGAPASLIAHHWRAAGELERSLPHYLRAAERALAAGAPESAGPWLGQVLRHGKGALRARAEELAGATAALFQD